MGKAGAFVVNGLRARGKDPMRVSGELIP
ncbi:MAG: hypothetical protein H6Q80_1018, partial [Deltaproteobacteria bacterium]|nr:hypothetical protein [Deltaproteobacteria bacterium]